MTDETKGDGMTLGSPACYVSAEHLAELEHFDGTETLLTKESFDGAIPLYAAQSAMRVDEAMVERAMDAARSVNRGLLTVAGMRAALCAAIGGKE